MTKMEMFTETCKEYFTHPENKYYRYLSINEYTIDALVRNSIWLAHPSTFNDPFDSRIRISDPQYDELILKTVSKFLCKDQTDPDHLELYSEEFLMKAMGTISKDGQWCPPPFTESLELISQRGHEQLYDFNKFIQSTVLTKSAPLTTYIAQYTGLGITCFSKRPFDPQMWAYYSANHKGICVEYDFGNVDFEASNFDLRSVDYKEELPEQIITDAAICREMLSKQICHKSKNWEHEAEIRLFSKLGSNKLLENPGKITGLCFGMNTSAQDKIRVKSLLKDVIPEKEFFDARKNHKWYSMDWKGHYMLNEKEERNASQDYQKA